MVSALRSIVSTGSGDRCEGLVTVAAAAGALTTTAGAGGDATGEPGDTAEEITTVAAGTIGGEDGVGMEGFDSDGEGFCTKTSSSSVSETYPTSSTILSSRLSTVPIPKKVIRGGDACCTVCAVG